MPHETRSRDRNRNIHTARDTLEVSHNNASHAVKFARLGAAYAIELAKGTLGPAAPPAQAMASAPATTPGAPIALWQLAGLVLSAVALIRLSRRVV